MGYPERVAAKAAEVRPARVLLALIAMPFYVLGFAVGIVWAALVWIFAAVQIGFSDARRNREAE